MLYLLFVLILPGVFSHNILVILLDDVDDLPPTRESGFPNITNYFTTNGATFNNAFVTTPICCPSRASIFTGTYQHNHHTWDNTVKKGCDGTNWDVRVAPNSIGQRLQDMKYRTGMFGKYSNNYNGVKVPQGWDEWLGLKGNSVYYNYTLNRNGKSETHKADPETDYLPNVILNSAMDFIAQNSTAPWFAFLSFPTAHEPFDAVPEFQSKFVDSTPPSTKFPSFNHTGDTGKHWYTKSRPSLTPYSAKYNELGWRRRLQSLQSVDRAFMKLLGVIDLKNTSIIFTSDNGFYFGEWGMILDKRQPYEVTIRVPMFASGPLFPKGVFIDQVALNIDIAPTIVDIATKLSGNTAPLNSKYTLPFDGTSMVPTPSASNPAPARTSYLVEYHGMGNAEDTNACSRKDMRCWYKDNQVWATQPTFDIPDGEKFCFCVDSYNNTFYCERKVATTATQSTEDDAYSNYLYCYFPSTKFNEFYDLHSDPFQMKNVWESLPSSTQKDLRKRVSKLAACRGFEACNVLSNGIESRLAA